MKNRKCIKCHKLLVGKHLLLCSNCKHGIGKGVLAVGSGAIFVGGTLYRFMKK